jgi:hypothetical protein
MKRNIIVLFLLLYSYIAFAEPSAVDILSLMNRFNTLVDGYFNHTTYCFYGFDEYSEAIIWQNSGGFCTLQMDTYWDMGTYITFGNGYPLDRHYKMDYSDYDENGIIRISAFMGQLLIKDMNILSRLENYCIGHGLTIIRLKTLRKKYIKPMNELK